jgi:tetratricopeptide (TPR) repeat protein
MLQVLRRSLHLTLRPVVLLVALTIAGGGTALVLTVPILGMPGYELALTLSLGVGLLGGLVGINAASLERRMIQGRDPRPRNALRLEHPIAAAGAALGAAVTLNFILLLVPTGVSVVRALTSTQCDPLAGFGFLPLLALPSAVIASAAGVFAGFLTRRGLLAAGVLLLLMLISAAATAYPLVFGPQVFAYNHFGGFLPGPLYDEALTVKPSLYWFRLETLLWAALLWLLTASCLDMRDGGISTPHFRPATILLLLAMAAGVFAIEKEAAALGLRISPQHLEEKLGGRRESEHFELIFFQGKPKEEVERLLRDLEFRHLQLKTFFGAAPDRKVRVYLYRSAGEKQALVGASRTQFAKPWRYELHVNDQPFPHSVLKHELAHVMAASFATGPFKATARYGVWPLMAIIEGLAVAADDPVDELTLHEWSAGMRQQKLMPDIRRILGPQGFFAAAPQRAYTAAGSFLRFLADRHGAEKLRKLYAEGDFQGAYGQSLDALATEWERFLDGVPLDPNGVNLAFSRFRRGSIFARPCAREIALLSAQAAERVNSDPQGAAELYARCAQVQPDEISYQLGQAYALSRADRSGEAAELLRKLADGIKEQPSAQSEVAMARADLAILRGRTEEAKEQLEKVISLQSGATADRTARVKLAALASPRAGKAIDAYFRPGSEDVKLLVLREALQAEPANPYLKYLLGRRLTQGQAATLALPYLEGALAGELPDTIRREALRLKLEAEYLAGDCKGVRHTVGGLADLGAAFRSQAGEWVARCDLDETVFKGPLVPEGPFR